MFESIVMISYLSSTLGTSCDEFSGSHRQPVTACPKKAVLSGSQHSETFARGRRARQKHMHVELAHCHTPMPSDLSEQANVAGRRGKQGF